MIDSDDCKPPRSSLDYAADLEWLDVPPVINAVGCPSRLGGVRYPREVVEAMVAAGQTFMPIDELQRAASREIAGLTGAEAGLVTTGSAGGLFLGACAILAGSDLARIDALPTTEGRPNEFVIHRTHRCPYDHVVRAAGARLVEFGFDWEGTGSFRWQLEAAITEKTVGILFQANMEHTGLPIDVVCEVARERGVSVLVDAAEELPPISALRRLLESGADLITVSGGKALRGPAGSGILAGRKDLILSAAMQSTDMYISEAMWNGPMGEPETEYPTPSHQGLGRMLKLGREEIVGLIAAIRMIRHQDSSEEIDRCTQVTEMIAKTVERHPTVATATIRVPEGGTPFVWMTFVSEAPAESARRVCAGLRSEHPRVYADDGQLVAGRIGFGPRNILLPEAEILVERLDRLLAAER